ncbi:MAG: DOMON-like domain-containing protein [Zoogloeaceae bacterium]|nr:DOMON-like domain-containing protein [Zoogloeaceae bacterium]
MPLADATCLTLHPHPATPRSALCAADVLLQPARDGLQLTYRLFGEVLRLQIPDPRPAARVDGLWRHSCCEAFISVPGTPAYREFNFSPSGEWAVYDFADYRQASPAPQADIAPEIHCRLAPDVLEVSVHLPAAWLPAGGEKEEFELGLSLVVETLGSSSEPQLSYWALRHAADHPDFHCRAGFMARFAHP